VESRYVQLKGEVEDLIVKAAQRDEVADARDSAADERGIAADLDGRLRKGRYRHDAEARQDACDDRLHSQGDRKASAMDRAFLAGDGCILCGRDG